jgi:DNA gyrase subunit A
MDLVGRGKKLLVVTENGYGKRTAVSDYKRQTRGGKGMLTYDKSRFDKTGYLIGAICVDDEDEVMLINSDGVVIRIKATDVSILSRATQGVKIMKVDDNSKIVAMAKVIGENDIEKAEADNAAAEDAAEADKQETMKF